jgi:hypothetical protein
MTPGAGAAAGFRPGVSLHSDVRKIMQIADIHTLTTRLVEADGILEFPEDGTQREQEQFSEALNEMLNKADGDDDALYAFFEYATSQIGPGGASYEWDAAEFQGNFEDSYKDSGIDTKKLLKDYYIKSGGDLSELAADKNKSDYFDWEGYTHNQRPDLTIAYRGRMTYLFEEQ